MGWTFARSLGGSLECLYWEVSARTVYAIADMPDSATAAAATARGKLRHPFRQYLAWCQR